RGSESRPRSPARLRRRWPSVLGSGDEDARLAGPTAQTERIQRAEPVYPCLVYPLEPRTLAVSAFASNSAPSRISVGSYSPDASGSWRTIARSRTPSGPLD